MTKSTKTALLMSTCLLLQAQAACGQSNSEGTQPNNGSPLPNSQDAQPFSESSQTSSESPQTFSESPQTFSESPQPNSESLRPDKTGGQSNAQAPSADGPPPASGDEAKPYKYTGNLYSHKFHRPRCPFSRAMAACKRTRFHFRYQAVAQGYKPCRYCLPPTWTTVRATIKCQDIDKTSANKKSADKSVDNIGLKAPLGTAGER
jgi:hypothetical protein